MTQQMAPLTQCRSLLHPLATQTFPLSDTEQGQRSKELIARLEVPFQRLVRILLPGTIYNYGRDALPVLREDSPQTATTHKGKIRIALEKKLEDAAREGCAR